MQTILGANGQIGEELARELKRNFTSDIRIVSRNAQKVNDTDEVFPADLLIKENAVEAVKNSEIAYFTVGLPISTSLWEEQFSLITRNVIDACKINGTKLVFFDNTYMYPQDGRVLTEDTEFAPVGRKGKVREEMTAMLLEEMNSGQIDAVICRAPEFYGPGKTQSITNTMIFNKIKEGQTIEIPLSTDKKRSLIWTPDASRATALIGNTADAYGQTWHLPVDNSHPTYAEFISLVSEIYEKEFEFTVIPEYIFQKGAQSSAVFAELLELLPRYACDNLFEDAKFRSRFPEFQTTSYREGIEQIRNEQTSIKKNQ
ncbi:NAD-dependent dehydratase [Chryseobacterium contaminans]|uniref:NAD-dependent dehydratase n=1 Tax=Chryseobacterium contaminans TaxID=1423959 RepID=A0A1M6ZHW5_9FLAO|nr:NAD-dependent epimerase/dehydratase family protein [Chryseobacterium contaminans]OCA78096.1 NAD-dependent dehydratase [Chryseobacterium contaminans]SHL29923.1 Nucleoside-diphosphate-sugar epimerase [Chryseobacterium contaminans]